MWPFLSSRPYATPKPAPEPEAPVDVCKLLSALCALKDDPLTKGFEAHSSDRMYGTSRIRFFGVLVAEISHLWTAGDYPSLTKEGYDLGAPLFQVMQTIIDEHNRRVAEKQELDRATAKAALEEARAALAARETEGDET